MIEVDEVFVDLLARLVWFHRNYYKIYSIVREAKINKINIPLVSYYFGYYIENIHL
jgi:hypothetical protein